MRTSDETLPLQPGIPPWMWFFILAFTFNLPALFRSWYASYEALLANIESVERLRTVDPNAERFSFLSYPGYFTENLPGIALFLGLSTILFPRLRAAYLERKNKLERPTAAVKSFSEIQEFIEKNAPGLQMKVNLKRPGLAFVYPNGYRRATVAIFSGFVMLWKTDRETAEAVLLHEIAHYRRGDALFLGPGSFLETAFKLTLLFYVIFVALPYIITTIDQKIQLADSLERTAAMQRELNEISRDLGLPEQTAPNYWSHLTHSILLSVFGLLATTVTFVVRTIVSFILPVAAIWAAEFNADTLVAENLHYKNALVHELRKTKARVTWWRRILFRLSHPPAWLRRFFINHRESIAFLLLLLIYPFAMLARIAGLHVWAFLTEAGIEAASVIGRQTADFNWQNFITISIDRTRIALASQSLEWPLMTALLLVWTTAVRPWERFFIRGEKQLPLGDGAVSIIAEQKSRFRFYVLGAVVTATVSLFALMWRK